MFQQMKKDSESILNEIIHLVYFMRGSIQYHDMLLMSRFERSLIGEFIERRLEQEKEKMYPIY
jgi:hypothetical protein